MNRRAEEAMKGDASIARRINRERVVVLGWGRAILMQLAHPLVAAGVGDHSTFTTHRFARVGRLHATIRAMLALTFGDEKRVRDAAARINAIHDRVNGRLPEAAGRYPAGTTYTATDPELLRWVHATLLDSLPLAYELLVVPLSDEEKDAYCAESVAVGRLLRMPEEMLFTGLNDLRQYMGRMLEGPDIHVTPVARRLARQMLYPPLTDPTRPGAWLNRLLSIGLLPPSLRRSYRFGWTRAHQAALGAAVTALKAGRRLSPAFVREWPDARRATA
jgi:uncharacterized protein (DUF2236 family)